MISIDSNDNIENLQSNYNIPENKPVVADNRRWIAQKWDDMFNDNFLNTLSSVGYNKDYWSGELGHNEDRSCYGWSSNNNQHYGIHYVTFNTTNWYGTHSGSIAGCNRDLELLCVCY